MATKPVIFAVDDEPAVLGAVARDVRRQFGKQYRVLSAGSGTDAIEALKQLKLRNEPVALFLVDQRMPRMTGVEFLEEAKQIYPGSKRALLTAYADTEAAIRAINAVKLDHYLTKPWDPPEENLYPVLSELLDEWQASFRPPFEGIRVVGHRWSPLSHQVKDFLARNLIPYRWLDVEVDEEAARLLQSAGADTSHLPLVFLPDGSYLAQPGNAEIAGKIGMQTRAAMPLYDLIVVGGGPAGLAAGVYGASEGLKTLLIEREAPGGQAGTSSRIENYLGFPSGVSGSELARRAVTQATRFGAEILRAQEVSALEVKDTYRVVRLSDGTELNGRSILIATGVSYRQLNAPGIERLSGAGVYYGSATTEAALARGKSVYIVGGGNSAGQAAMHLSEFAQHVTILIRGESLSITMSQYLIDQIAATANITVRPCSNVVEVSGGDCLEAITVADSVTGQRETIPADFLFIFIGAQPRTDWVSDKVERDAYGFILTGPDVMRGGQRPRGWSLDRDPFFLESSVPGIFVAGDVRHRSVKRIASAVGEGAMAVQFVHQYLASL
ncbi:MAG TPA: FAD-dependent oxidoreductase [Ardenticatenaceae bacterium]|nr:FAD-dependent oxidoreductase [Ardenticatenaceae bacterium]